MRQIAAFGLAVSLLLSACQQPAGQHGQAAPDGKPGFAISDGRLVLPAVSGNPGAAYFKLTNNSGKDAAIAAIAVDGVWKSEIHDSSGGGMTALREVPVKAGETVEFAPGGKHLMAFELAPEIDPAHTVEMTITFADGDKISTTMRVLNAAGVGFAPEHEH